MDKPYIHDKIENLGKYVSLGANFAAAIAYLEKTRPEDMAVGKTVIDGENSWSNLMPEAQLKPLAERKPEVHHKYFDIQIPLSGEELFGLATFDPSAPGSFDVAKDIGFYDQPVESVIVKPGEFVILFPNTCAHAPQCSPTGVPQTIRKIVVKVRA